MPLTVQKLEHIMGVSAEHATERIAELTPRENQVANLLADGRHPREIASEFGISPKTIDIHRGKVKMKLGAKSTADVVRCMLLKRLVDALEGVVGKEAKRRARARSRPV
jgi:DNA-binding CsgD family transcriptional regulator